MLSLLQLLNHLRPLHLTDNTSLTYECEPSFPYNGPLYQNEVKCSAFDMEMIFHSHVNKTHFQKRGGAFGLILKVRVFGARKWPIFLDNHSSHNSYLIPLRTVKSAARKSENIGVFTQV